MRESLVINGREQIKRQQIIDAVLTSVERFRLDAKKAFSDFNLNDRKLVDGLDAKDISSYSVLSAWQEDLRPMQNTLQNKRSESDFSKLLIDNLLLDGSEAQSKIDQIITDRESEILHDFIASLYPITKNRKKDKYAEQRKLAYSLLSRPESEIDQIRNHQIDYILYKEIAKQNDISVIDTHTSLIKRIKSRIHINAERKKTIKSENKRLSYINNRLEILSVIDGGLIVEIFEKKFDLIVIFGLRNQYEKRIGKLSATDAKNAVKHLEIFDEETQSFKKEQTEKLTISSDQVSLETIRSITKDIDDLLLRIFDLTNIQKNQLLLYSKEYRELTQEKEAIKTLQNNRFI